MANHDLEDEIDEFAKQIESSIESNRELLADLPEFEARSQRSRKLEDKVDRLT